MRIVGRVAGLAVYPLKSAQGVALDEADLTGTGLAGDRRWALTVDGEVVGAKQVPGLAALRVRCRDDALWVEVDGGLRPADARTLAGLLGLTGRVELVEDAAGHPQMASVHLVSRDAPDLPGCGVEPRANIVLELGSPGEERRWLDSRVGIGSGELSVTRLPKRCLGVYAEVIRPGRVRVGDEVRIRTAAPAGVAAGG